MATTNWQASKNPFMTSMQASAKNGLNVFTFTRNALFKNKGNADPGFMVIYSETDVLYQELLAALGLKTSTETGKEANTENVEVIFKDMSSNLNLFDDATRKVFGSDTLEYKTVWGKTRDRFYSGPYTERLSSLLGLAKAMNQYPTLSAAADRVMAYYSTILLGRETQQGLITDFKTDGVTAAAIMEKCIKQMDRNLGWLKFFYALDDDAQGLINAYFDLSLIIIHNDKTYPVIVPKAGFPKVCLRTFKSTDVLEIEVDGPEDVYICLKEDGKTPCDTKAYKALAGKKLKLPVGDVFPDLTGRQVMATNTSMVTATHIIFTIIEE